MLGVAIDTEIQHQCLLPPGRDRLPHGDGASALGPQGQDAVRVWGRVGVEGEGEQV